jgi:O-antigen/teichoic acid export membrane protein
LLGPAAFGAWSLFRLAGRYLGVGGLGIHRGLELEIVRARTPGGDDPAPEADRAGETALGFYLLVFGSLAILGVGASFFLSDPGLVLGVRALAIGILAEQLMIYVSVSLRARGELRRFALSEVVSAALQLAFGAALAIAFGLAGAYVGFLIAGVLSVLLFARHVPFRPRWSPGRLATLIRIGFPMALLLLVTLVLGSVDRVVVVAFGGTTLLGYYAFAAALAALAATASWVVRTIVFPAVYREAAGSGSRVAIRYHLRQSLLPFSVVAPPLLGMAGILLGPLVAELLPQYGAAVAPARMFLFTGVATGLANLATVAVLAAERHRWVPGWAALGVAVNLGLSVVALTQGLGLLGVAAGTLLSQALYSGAILHTMATVGGYRSGARVVAAILGPTLWCAAVLAAIQYVIPMTSFGSAALGLPVFLLFCFPLWGRLRRLERRIGWRAHRPAPAAPLEEGTPP